MPSAAAPGSIGPNRARSVLAADGGAFRGKHRRGPRPQGMRTMRGLPGPVLCAGCGLRLPPAPGQVHQHVRPQVRAGAPGCRLGHLAGPQRTPRGPGVPRQLPGRGHAGVPDQLLPPGGPDRRPVLPLPAPGLRRLPAYSPGLLRDRAVSCCRDRQTGPVRAALRQQPQHRDPTVTWRIAKGEDPGYTLFDLADRLRGRGWQVPAYTLTGTASDIAVQRVLVRLGVSRDMASLLLDDFRDAVAHFGRHPVTVPMSKEESGGFNHL